jgi:hypothetical protein
MRGACVRNRRAAQSLTGIFRVAVSPARGGALVSTMGFWRRQETMGVEPTARIRLEHFQDRKGIKRIARRRPASTPWSRRRARSAPTDRRLRRRTSAGLGSSVRAKGHATIRRTDCHLHQANGSRQGDVELPGPTFAGWPHYLRQNGYSGPRPIASSICVTRDSNSTREADLAAGAA